MIHLKRGPGDAVIEPCARTVSRSTLKRRRGRRRRRALAQRIQVPSSYKAIIIVVDSISWFCCLAPAQTTPLYSFESRSIARIVPAGDHFLRVRSGTALSQLLLESARPPRIRYPITLFLPHPPSPPGPCVTIVGDCRRSFGCHSESQTGGQRSSGPSRIHRPASRRAWSTDHPPRPPIDVDSCSLTCQTDTGYTPSCSNTLFLVRHCCRRTSAFPRICGRRLHRRSVKRERTSSSNVLLNPPGPPTYYHQRGLVQGPVHLRRIHPRHGHHVASCEQASRLGDKFPHA